MNIVLLKHGAGVYLDKGISDSPGRKHKFTTFNVERLQASTFFTLIFDGGGGVILSILFLLIKTTEKVNFM